VALRPSVGDRADRRSRRAGALPHVTEHCAPCGGRFQVGAQGARQRSRLRAVAVIPNHDQRAARAQVGRQPPLSSQAGSWPRGPPGEPPAYVPAACSRGDRLTAMRRHQRPRCACDLRPQVGALCRRGAARPQAAPPVDGRPPAAPSTRATRGLGLWTARPTTGGIALQASRSGGAIGGSPRASPPGVWGRTDRRGRRAARTALARAAAGGL